MSAGGSAQPAVRRRAGRAALWCVEADLETTIDRVLVLPGLDLWTGALLRAVRDGHVEADGCAVLLRSQADALADALHRGSLGGGATLSGFAVLSTLEAAGAFVRGDVRHAFRAVIRATEHLANLAVVQARGML